LTIENACKKGSGRSDSQASIEYFEKKHCKNSRICQEKKLSELFYSVPFDFVPQGFERCRPPFMRTHFGPLSQISAHGETPAAGPIRIEADVREPPFSRIFQPNPCTKGRLTNPRNGKSPLPEFTPAGVISLKSDLLDSPSLSFPAGKYFHIGDRTDSPARTSPDPSAVRRLIRRNIRSIAPGAAGPFRAVGPRSPYLATF